MDINKINTALDLQSPENEDKIKKVTYEPLFMTLKSIFIESLYCNRKSSAGFHWWTSILIDPPFVNRAKAAHSKKTFTFEVPCCQLQLIKSKVSKLGSDFQFLASIRSGWSRWFDITGCRRWQSWSNGRISGGLILRFSWNIQKLWAMVPNSKVKLYAHI